MNEKWTVIGLCLAMGGLFRTKPKQRETRNERSIRADHHGEVAQKTWPAVAP